MEKRKLHIPSSQFDTVNTGVGLPSSSQHFYYIKMMIATSGFLGCDLFYVRLFYLIEMPISRNHRTLTTISQININTHAKIKTSITGHDINKLS